MAARQSSPVVTLSDRVLEQIEFAIFQGMFEPGSKLSEATLARAFGISRGPLREALRRLEGRKLVERIPHVGARVISLSEEDRTQLFLIREVLEGLACRQAAENMPAEEVAELQSILHHHQRREALREGVAYYQEAGDLDFHYRIALGSRNQKLIELLCGDLYYLVRLYRYRGSRAPGRATRAFEEHLAILEAIRGHDPERAERLMRQHIAVARTTLRYEQTGGQKLARPAQGTERPASGE